MDFQHCEGILSNDLISIVRQSYPMIFSIVTESYPMILSNCEYGFSAQLEVGKREICWQARN